MLLRSVLIFLLVVFILRALWRLVSGIIEGIAGSPPVGGPPQRGVHMVRDPVCGTFVVPETATTLPVGTKVIHFCSPACRDKYRARTA
jgi:hypothetical protein